MYGNLEMTQNQNFIIQRSLNKKGKSRILKMFKAGPAKRNEVQWLFKSL